MKTWVNEHPVDRLARVVVGLILLALVFTGPRTPWGWIGLVPLVTGIVGWCPLYRLLRVGTCSPRGRRSTAKPARG